MIHRFRPIPAITNFGRDYPVTLVRAHAAATRSDDRRPPALTGTAKESDRKTTLSRRQP